MPRRESGHAASPFLRCDDVRRLWGRAFQPEVPGQGHSAGPNEVRPWTWVAVVTDPSGDESNIWILNLVQVLLLNRNESPFFANYGIPAQQSVLQQVYPDVYVQMTQQQFAPYFASLSIARVPDTKPHYRINCTTLAGAVISREVLI